MQTRYNFNLTPAYCLYNGAAVLEQKGAYIRFLVENKNDELLCGRLTRAFENHIANIRKLKDCPEDFRRLIKIDFEKGSRAQLRKCVSNLYKAESSVAGTGGVVGAGADMSDALEFKTDSASEIERNKREAAAVLLLDSILNEARLRAATDIHIEKSCVRLRVNGALIKLLELQSEKSSELVQRIKLLAGMNVIENRRCQDGHFIYGNKAPFILRVSTMAVMGERYSGSESVVLRLLDTSRIPLALGELGFTKKQLEKLCGENGIIFLNNGLILVCGPTGSGKSTTVASMLVEIERRAGGSLKIISLEDPPEYVIPGVTQVKVDERNTFSDALNHVFRQDPDVIMIGEIRDEQSAAAAVRASLTGHLVFASLHCGSAAEAFLRLENLGIERELLIQVFRGVICQELNYINGKIRLYSDLAIPEKKFKEEAGDLINPEQLEELMEHYSNFGEVFGETAAALKRKAEERRTNKTTTESKKRRKTSIPLYKRRKSDAGIHKSAV